MLAAGREKEEEGALVAGHREGEEGVLAAGREEEEEGALVAGHGEGEEGVLAVGREEEKGRSPPAAAKERRGCSPPATRRREGVLVASRGEEKGGSVLMILTNTEVWSSVSKVGKFSYGPIPWK